MITFTHLLCLEKVCKKIYFKEYCLVKQNLCKLKTEEVEVATMGSIPTMVKTTNTLGVVSLVFKVY